MENFPRATLLVNIYFLVLDAFHFQRICQCTVDIGISGQCEDSDHLNSIFHDCVLGKAPGTSANSSKQEEVEWLRETVLEVGFYDEWTERLECVKSFRGAFFRCSLVQLFHFIDEKTKSREEK